MLRHLTTGKTSPFSKVEPRTLNVRCRSQFRSTCNIYEMGLLHPHCRTCGGRKKQQTNWECRDHDLRFTQWIGFTPILHTSERSKCTLHPFRKLHEKFLPILLFPHPKFLNNGQSGAELLYQAIRGCQQETVTDHIKPLSSHFFSFIRTRKQPVKFPQPLTFGTSPLKAF